MPSAILFLITFLLLLAIFGFLAFLRRPFYQINETNLSQLFDLVLAGEASVDDWNVFIEMPIRYNDELESIRLKCVEITERFSVRDKYRFLLSEEGRAALKMLRVTLKE